MATVPNRPEGGPLHDALLVLGTTPDITFGPVQYEHHNTIPFGEFIRYTHSGTVPNGTAVGVVISQGPPAAIIPTLAVDFQPEDVLGAQLKIGRKQLKRHGITPRVLTEIEAPGQKGNRIVAVRRVPGRPNHVDLDIAKKKWYER